MKSQSTSHIVSTQNTNTTFSPFKCCHAPYSTSPYNRDEYEICAPEIPSFPYDKLPENKHSQSLSFTIILLILLAFIRLQSRNVLTGLLQLLFKRKKIELILSEDINYNLFYYIILLCFSATIVTVFTSLHTENADLFTPSNFYFWSFLLLYHMLLLGIIQLLGWVFNAKYVANECMINLWAFHIDIGISLFPFLIIFFFAQNFAAALIFKIALSIVGFIFIAKIIRWLQILISYKVSILYMILYLCALEIAPLLILYKIITVLGNN